MKHQIATPPRPPDVAVQGRAVVRRQEAGNEARLPFPEQQSLRAEVLRRRLPPTAVLRP